MCRWVQLDEGFDRAWRRVGLALDRTGFTVEDRNRNEGTYFVRYVAPDTEKKEPGFFSKLFSSTSATPPPASTASWCAARVKQPPCRCSTSRRPRDLG